MKRLSVIAGFILFLAFSPVAQADGTGLSDSISRIMEHAQRGIDYAQSDTSGTSMADDEVASWIDVKQIPIFLSVDTRYSLIENSKEIERQTICFRFDLWVIEQKMMEVEGLMQEALDSGLVFRELALRDVYEYLDKQHNQLLEGGLNPEVSDAEWDAPYLWELIDAEYDEEDEDEPELLYYFNTDYLPPSDEGGCDAETIKRAQGLLTGDAPGMQEALEERLRAQEIAERFVEQWDSPEGIDTLQQTVDELIGTGPAVSNPENPARQPRVHRTLSGYVEEIPEGFLMWSWRGYFSADHNDLPLLEEYWKQTRNEGAESPTSRAYTWLDDAHPLFQRLFLNDERALQEFVAGRSGQTSATFAVGADPGLSIEDDFEPLRKAVVALVRVGNSLDYGLRAFVRDFGSWMYRICTKRPGTAILTRTLNAVFTDECFPYGNGQYLENPEIWRVCKEAVGQ